METAKETCTVKTPWVKNLGDVPAHLEYPEWSMCEGVEKIAEKYPNLTAYVFMGRKTSYRALVQEIHLCARALKSIGVRAGDKITIAMPNCPQAVIMFYAVNLVGAVANMIHPLSSEKEIEFYLNESGSISAITLDQFYHKFEAIRQNVNLDNVIIASIKDALSQPIKAGYMLTEGRKLQKIPKDAPILRWREFLMRGRSYHWKYKADVKAGDPAVILYSGGTTGITKGILLSNLNFNALAAQIIATNPFFRPGDSHIRIGLHRSLGQLRGKTSLFAIGGILMDDPLRHGLIQGGGGLTQLHSRVLGIRCNRGVELLNGSTDAALHHAVPQGFLRSNLYALLSGLNVRQLVSPP